ncbi:DUF6328 family protein [Streptoalloteichus hindustanus]|uniref:Integral membrane protein n=1 Tax=Streptoalloteichus hindustanus TaxID=2017 RepID=A0A1M4U5D8_STRHI|nr:DUF6328 family protein [Streptoalloteichus hindustanus]SHE52051.1 hypothetical protein SAMN05444320_101309 [Streptoalloteichus hindustanus]
MSEPEADDRERLVRNLNELLQELRVAQAGVQILFAFLLGAAFTEPFRDASPFQRALHLVTVMLATGATALLTAPAAWHRLLFRHGRREQIVRAANRFALAGLALLAAAMTGAVALVADVVLSGWWAVALGGVSGTLYAFLWFVWPSRLRHDDQR